jgi:integrase
MPRTSAHSHLVNGKLIRFSVCKYSHLRGYVACFSGPDGRRLQRATGQERNGPAIDAARILIEEVYAPPVVPLKATWDQAVERLSARLKTSGLRDSTLGYYLKLIRLVRAAFPNTNGPADVTPDGAAEWRDTITAQPGRRKKLPSAHYVAGLIGGLSALWQKWFIDDLKLPIDNPWRDVAPPKADKLPVKYADDDVIEHFYGWLAERFGEWPFAKLFLSVKAYTGCRLMDLCSLRSAQLKAGRLIFPADTAKGRKERRVPLPDDLQAALESFKGPTWLWENYLPGLVAALQAKGWPTHQMVAEFSPKRLYYWMETLFADYQTANPGRRLTSHMFRKRAFTLAWEAGIDMRQASIAYGCNVDTLMKHYVAMDEQAVTDDVFGRMHSSNSQANGRQLKPKTA